MKTGKILKDYKGYLKKAHTEEDYQFIYENILIECFFFSGEATEGRLNKLIEIVFFELDKMFVSFAKSNNALNPFFEIYIHQFRSCLVMSKPDIVTKKLFESYGWDFYSVYKEIYNKEF